MSGREHEFDSNSNLVVCGLPGDENLERYVYHRESDPTATWLAESPGVRMAVQPASWSLPAIPPHSTNGHSTNDLYSAYALTDSDGDVVERYIYDPYGKATVLDGNGTPRTVNESLYGNPWTFTGRRLDGETGLMYYRARMYSVDLGRFCQRDPAKYKGNDWNLYAYVGDKPTVFLDPSGMVPELGLEIKLGPEPGNCGAFKFYTTWTLSEAPPVGGYIVQIVHMKDKYRRCDGGDWIETDLTYREAWWVNSGSRESIWAQLTRAYNSRGVSGWDDRFESDSAGICTEGKTTVKGKAKFYQGMYTLPPGWTNFNPETQAGALPSSPDLSAGLPPPSTITSTEETGVSNEVSKEIDIEWNCCTEETKTIIRSHTP
jgi:RHS repeat-associated protein